MKYILTIDYHIEARNAHFAEDSLIYDNGVADKKITYTDLSEAEEAYKNAVEELQAPKELRRGFYWYSGAILEAFDDEDEFVDLIYANVREDEHAIQIDR